MATKEYTIGVLSAVLISLPIGTNLALLHFMWMLISGALLPHRGAVFPALQSIGLPIAAIRRSWTAMRKGHWQIATLVDSWRKYVRAQPEWRERRYEGYLPVPADITAFWRPTLRHCPSQHYHPLAQRAVSAVIFGLYGEVGELNGQRLALPRAITRVQSPDNGESQLWETLLKELSQTLQDDEIAVLDAGVKLKQVQQAQLPRYVLRLPVNFTARRNYLPETHRGRKPKYGPLVRPLARTYKGKTVAATPPDETTSWAVEGRTLRAEIWRKLVLPHTPPAADNATFDVYAIYDPRFKQPWLLAVPLALQAQSVCALYSDRWPVEQLPLSAKQMLGAQRQFVHNAESVQRLPELALLVGSVLSFLAATFPPVPTGFWDRNPKRTPGRLRRLLMGQPFPEDVALPEQFRKKNAVTAHLPKGILARRSKTPVPSPT